MNIFLIESNRKIALDEKYNTKHPISKSGRIYQAIIEESSG